MEYDSHKNDAYWIAKNYPEGQWWKRSIFVLLWQIVVARYSKHGRKQARLHKLQG